MREVGVQIWRTKAGKHTAPCTPRRLLRERRAQTPSVQQGVPRALGTAGVGSPADNAGPSVVALGVFLFLHCWQRGTSGRKEEAGNLLPGVRPQQP